MQDMGIRSIIKTKRKRSDPKNMNVRHQNLVEWDFHSDERNNKFFTDVIYIKTSHVPNGFIYISAFIDGFNFETKGISYSYRNDVNLVMDSLQRLNANNCIIHSDHGVQYSSKKYYEYVKYIRNLTF